MGVSFDIIDDEKLPTHEATHLIESVPFHKVATTHFLSLLIAYQ